MTGILIGFIVIAIVVVFRIKKARKERFIAERGAMRMREYIRKGGSPMVDKRSRTYRGARGYQQ